MSDIKRFAAILPLVWPLLLCSPAGAQTLVYALSYGETRGSLHARFPKGVLGAPIDERLAMLRSFRKTEIHSVSMVDQKRTLLFSDEGTNFEIRPLNQAFAAGRAYVTGVERHWRSTPNPGAYSEPSAIYELSLDGSNRFRRLLETRENQMPLVLNRAGRKAVFESFEDGEYLAFVYELPAWTLLHRWSLAALGKAHCPACLPASYGWLADGDRLFFNLDLGDEDDDQEAAAETNKNPNTPGTYILADDGTDLGALPVRAGHLELPGYLPQETATAVLIGQLPGGGYLFHDFALQKALSPKASAALESFLVFTTADFSPVRHIPLEKIRLGTCTLSPSGRYLAFMEDRMTPDYRTERHLWGMDLESGTRVELFVAPSPNPPDSKELNIVLTVLGFQ
jgi:hypothetical protein